MKINSLLSVRWPWFQDLRTTRILRFAIAVTASVAISFGCDWPIPYLVPVLTAFILVRPLPGPNTKQFVVAMLSPAFAFALGLAFTLLGLRYPLVYLPALGLVLFHVYYLALRGGPFLLVLLSLLAVTVLPVLGAEQAEFAAQFAIDFAFIAATGIGLGLLAHALLPDPPGGDPEPAPPAFVAGYSSEAALGALKLTVVILPLTAFFTLFSLFGEVLVVVFAVLFSLSPGIAEDGRAAVGFLMATVLGGIAALVFFWLVVAVPTYPFLLSLMFLAMLLLASGIFSGHPKAVLIPSVANALLILIGSNMGDAATITDKVAIRMLLISIAGVYIVFSLRIIDSVLSHRRAAAP